MPLRQVGDPNRSVTEVTSLPDLRQADGLLAQDHFQASRSRVYL